MRHFTPKILTTAALLLLGLTVTIRWAGAQAATNQIEGRAGKAGGKGERVEWTLTPYFWGAGLYGGATIGDTEADVDMDFGDIWDNLDLAAMADLRVEMGRWAIQSNLVWADLEADGSGPYGRADIDVEMQLWIVELEGRYRFAENWEVLAGARYYDVESDIKIRPPAAPTIRQSGSEDWVDPIIGLAFRAPLSERWSFHGRGDIGGFGAGSDFSWQLIALFDYRIAKSASVGIGYRHLDWDYDEGSGEDKFALDTYMTGPLLSLSLRF